MHRSYIEFIRMQGDILELEAGLRYPRSIISIFYVLAMFSKLIRTIIELGQSQSKIYSKYIEFIVGEKHFEISKRVGLESVKIVINLKNRIREHNFDGYSDRWFIIRAPLYSDAIVRLYRQMEFELWARYGYRIMKQAIIESAILRRYDCETIVLYNDHTPYCISAMDYFKSRNAKTVYIQHAPVGPNFPPLRWDLSILYSQRYVDIYRDINLRRGLSWNEERIQIVGDFRLDKLKSVRRDVSKIHRVLLAYNELDKLEMIEHTFHSLTKLGLVVNIRSHPLDKRKVTFARVSETSLEEDLRLNDAVVCNESAIALEAAFCGLFVYKASFWSKPLDNYGFIASGLIRKEFKDLKSLVNAVSANRNYIDNSKIEYFTGMESGIGKNVKTLIYEILN